MAGLIGGSPFVDRSEWQARAPKSVSKNITPEGNTVHWEGPGMGPYNHEKCAQYLRSIQNNHMDAQGWADIAYTSVECRHGYIYQGRWIGRRTAANGTNEGNQLSYAHCALFGVGDELTPEMRRAVRDVIVYFRGQGSGNRLWDHNDWRATQCAGIEFDRLVKSGELMQDVPTAVTPPGQPQPPPPPPLDWYEEMILALPVMNFNQNPGTHLIDNVQGLLKGTQNGGCDPGAIDNLWGPKTAGAVKAFQRMAGLLDDGICGPKTWRKLIEW